MYKVFSYDDLDSCIFSILTYIMNNKITSFLKEKRQKGFFGNGPCWKWWVTWQWSFWEMTCKLHIRCISRRSSHDDLQHDFISHTIIILLDKIFKIIIHLWLRGCFFATWSHNVAPYVWTYPSKEIQKKKPSDPKGNICN